MTMINYRVRTSSGREDARPDQGGEARSFGVFGNGIPYAWKRRPRADEERQAGGESRAGESGAARQ
jgi:hypothetical protein